MKRLFLILLFCTQLSYANIIPTLNVKESRQNILVFVEKTPNNLWQLALLPPKVDGAISWDWLAVGSDLHYVTRPIYSQVLLTYKRPGKYPIYLTVHTAKGIKNFHTSITLE